ncbi:MAG: 3-isopropylmalate dehydrogenase [Clostridia bacterium]|nr:3-isopropylmalate dehydrogenase [Clostridia bacterium]
MNKKITVLKGDGIGPEIVDEALKVLDKIGEKYGHTFEKVFVDMGGCSIDKYGVPITDEGLEKCKNCDSVLLGAVGGPKWDTGIDPSKRPEKALLKVRSELGLFANLRPTKMFGQLKGASPLKESGIKDGLDLMIVRELTGGIYFGEHKTFEVNGEAAASDLMYYSEHEIERIGRVAFETARKRGKKVHSVDKANVLDSSKLWRKVMHKLAEEYSDVEYSDILVDNTAMQLIRNPGQFDVIVTENMFGDILSDEASMLTGSIGMMPSASLSSGTLGMYEPIHGSAPDIAGMNIANPLGTILSAAMMLRYSFDMIEEADAVERAVDEVLNEGYRTVDIAGKDEGITKVSCSEMGDLVCSKI